MGRNGARPGAAAARNGGHTTTESGARGPTLSGALLVVDTWSVRDARAGCTPFFLFLFRFSTPSSFEF